MRRRLALLPVLVLLIAGCMPRHGSGPSPVKCAPAPALDAQDVPVVGHVSLNSRPSSIMRGPYKVELDDRIVAEAHNDDPRAAAKVLGGIDPETIESIEMVRSDKGDIVRIRRCYAATTH